MSMRRGEAARCSVAAHPRAAVEYGANASPSSLIGIPGVGPCCWSPMHASAQIVAHEAARLLQAITDYDLKDAAVVTTQ
jgi:hypothetical protein